MAKTFIQWNFKDNVNLYVKNLEQNVFLTDPSLLLVVLVGVVSGAILSVVSLMGFLHWIRLRQKSCADPNSVKTKQVDLNTLDSEEEYSSEQDDWLNTMQGTEQTNSNGSNQSKVRDNANTMIEVNPTFPCFSEWISPPKT